MQVNISFALLNVYSPTSVNDAGAARNVPAGKFNQLDDRRLLPIDNASAGRGTSSYLSSAQEVQPAERGDIIDIEA